MATRFVPMGMSVTITMLVDIVGSVTGGVFLPGLWSNLVLVIVN
jgi:hypothetical protein